MVSGHINPRGIHHIASFVSAIPDDTVDIFIVALSCLDACRLHSPLLFRRFSFRILITSEKSVKRYS